jgi:hypothetical protein
VARLGFIALQGTTVAVLYAFTLTHDSVLMLALRAAATLRLSAIRSRRSRASCEERRTN